MPKLTNAERAKNFRKRQKEKAKAAGQQKNPARTSTERSREHRAREREKRPSIISTTRPKKPQNTPVSLAVNCSVEKMSSSESAEPAGWLRLGDLAIGDGGVCVTSLIKDKIREYMLNEEQQQTTATSTTAAAVVATVANTAQATNSGDVTCVRRIGNSLDLLLRESRNAGHAVAAATAKNKTSSSSPPSFATAAVDVASAGCAVITAPVDHVASTAVITAPADSSRPTVNRPLPPLPPLFTKRYFTIEDEMQISRMPIPADDCANSEMSVDTSPSDTKTDDLETTTKVNGDSHKKLNGTTVDNSIETDEASSQLVIKKEENDEDDNEEEKAEKEKDPENKTEPLSKTTDKIVKNGVSEEQNSVETINGETSTTNNDDPIVNEDKDEEEKPMEIDETEDQTNEDLAIKKETLEVDEPEITEDVETQETEKHINGNANQKDEVITTSNEVLKNREEETNPVNGEVKLEDDKNFKSEKVNRKVLEEEDMSSEISTDTLSPKQMDEPIARKRSAASHDELSVVSGASSDNDLPKTKKLRSDEDQPLLKDDTRERLIKNIVQSSGKNEVELNRNVEKIQNEIKVITEIAQTKRDELVTLIRLQKLKEEIIERLMIKLKEFDAIKTDNSKDWNLPEMFQINLSQPEHILSEKNILDIIDNRGDSQLEKSAINNYDQNMYASSSSNTSITPVASSSNAQSNEWIVSDRVNRTNRVQRPILPKPSAANNHKEGRQGPILDVKLIIADHRSKNPETAVTKRGRRKVNVNDFSVPTSSAPLRYPNPMGFGNPVHHTSDGNFKTKVTLHPVSQPMQQQQQLQQQQQQQQQLLQQQQIQQPQPTSLLHGILTKGAGTHHLPLSMSHPPTNYSPTLARLLTAPERCKQSRGKRQAPAATVVSSNAQSRNEITITPVQSTSMSSTFQQKPSCSSNIPPAQVDDEDASDRLVIDEGQDVMNANSPSSAPQCQGCMQKPAQFVCAGCGNQWYCSKDCQIDAWDDHSEVCSG
ncbi:rac guanine nucleotide exchange factor JJ-like isoform X2 [Metopolophium dirhodum]|uniref:rac guanine nucleotide exchange factor JJ-like isoform X2 n=1 Tax=Metopolophium dirhodum TaxID=44670 RepID=UPI00299005DD|nr:rac guanine nucleotide exchange factor JJ-like isoform X2 [Metopolophium dirhodum]